jgi:uncharacterized membrane protein YgcG
MIDKFIIWIIRKTNWCRGVQEDMRSLIKYYTDEEDEQEIRIMTDSFMLAHVSWMLAAIAAVALLFFLFGALTVIIATS